MSTCDLSVIIPVYNKAEILPRTLRALDGQTMARGAFEVIVADDGSTDNPGQLVGAMTFAYPLRFVRQENKGAGAARNLGATLGRGEILLFLDADIVLDPQALAAHLQAHRRRDRALILGRIRPLMPNPVGLEDLLFQASFDFGTQEQSLPWHCTLTQCLSIRKADFWQIGAFDAALLRGQDIEFGYRAAQQGLAIRYCPQAVGRHNHALDLRQRCEVERRNHKRLVAFFRKRPHLAAEVDYLRYKWPVNPREDRLPLTLRKMARHCLAWDPALRVLESAWPVVRRSKLPLQAKGKLYWSIVGSYQLRGLGDGLRQHDPLPLPVRAGEGG